MCWSKGVGLTSAYSLTVMPTRNRPICKTEAGRESPGPEAGVQFVGGRFRCILGEVAWRFRCPWPRFDPFDDGCIATNGICLCDVVFLKLRPAEVGQAVPEVRNRQCG